MNELTDYHYLMNAWTGSSGIHWECVRQTDFQTLP